MWFTAGLVFAFAYMAAMPDTTPLARMLAVSGLTVFGIVLGYLINEHETETLPPNDPRGLD